MHAQECDFILTNSIVHQCDADMLGSIDLEFADAELVSDYNWTDGFQGLDRQDLLMGTYTLQVLDEKGCECEKEFIINGMMSYELDHIVTDEDDCRDRIEVILLYNGNPIPTDGISLNWSDGQTTNSFIRVVDKSDLINVSVELGMPMAEICFSDSHQIFLDAENVPGCVPSCNCPLIVNEFGVFGESSSQYVELVVNGSPCEGTTDISLCHIDDNNGALIPPISNITQNELELAGISMGYLQFSSSNQWQNIPNGSTIVIVEENANPYEFDFDPFDADNNNVYVLKADNSQLLYGGNGVWNMATQRMRYSGGLTSPRWELIEINEGGDGMQIVGRDFDICHGLAYGNNDYLENSTWPLWSDGYLTANTNCSFLGSVVWESSNYACSTDVIPTPGNPNNPANELYINNLLSCEGYGLIHGYVYQDVNQNGIKDDGDLGFVNVDVDLLDVDGNVITVSTDLNGYYFTDIKAGPVEIDVQENDPDFPNGALQVSGVDPNTIEVILGDDNHAGDDGYILLAYAFGTLYYDINGNGDQDIGEGGIPDVDILIESADGGGTQLTVTTDSDGFWNASLPGGTYSADIDELDIDYPIAAVQTEGEDPTNFIATEGSETDAGNDGYLSQFNVMVNAYLEGALVSQSGGLEVSFPMRTSLNDIRVLPGQLYVDPLFGSIYQPPGQPYAAHPWNYSDVGSLDEGQYFDSENDPSNADANYPEDIVDWVLISVREDIEKNTEVCREAGLLRNDGLVLFVKAGQNQEEFYLDDQMSCINPSQNAYFIVIEHRNHLLAMSHMAIEISGENLIQYDFTKNHSYLNFIGSTQKIVNSIFHDNGDKKHTYALFAGNSNQENSAQLTDLNVNDKLIWELNNNLFPVYVPADFNLSADTNVNDKALWQENNNHFSSVPY